MNLTSPVIAAGVIVLLGGIMLIWWWTSRPTLSGGLRALLNRIRHLLKTECLTANGKRLGENIAGAEVINPKVIFQVDQPLSSAGATFILRGNLAPDGCVIKPTAAEPRLLKHTGKAVVFENYADLKKRIDDENLDVTADSVLVLKSGGPIGAPSDVSLTRSSRRTNARAVPRHQPDRR